VELSGLVEVKSGRPIEVLAQDKNGKVWLVQVSVNILDAVPTGNLNPDGSAEFKLNMNLAFSTRPAEASA
jgi:hypothetical protein